MANTYKPKNILITGAAGFIASHVCNRLTRNHPDYKIIVLDKLDYCSNLKNLLPSRSSPENNFKFIKGDIGSPDIVNYILLSESIDTIMHFAAQTHVDNSFGNSFEFTKNNIYGTHVLLEACKKFMPQIKRFIHVSTDEVYGETDEDAIVGNHEASQLLPTNPYSATKAGAEMLVMAYARSYGLPMITTRGNNVYGPNQFPEKLIPKFMLLAMKGETLPIHGDGSNVRSYLYCEDVAEAFEVVLHRGEVGHVYNIGTKKERRVIDVARDICNLFSLDPDTHIKFVENRPFNDQRYYLDDQKLKNLGWFERTSWEEGLRKTMECVLGKISEKQGILFEYGKGDLEVRSQVMVEIETIKPTHVFNASSVATPPNVKWFEDHRHETIRSDVVGVLNLADVCKEHGIFLVNYDVGSNFEDKGNSDGSFYSKTQSMVEELLKDYENVCTARLWLPVSSDLSNPHNFITKIARSNKVANIANNISVLDELVPISIEMAKRKCKGFWNLKNPGMVTLNEILGMYKDYVDPNFKWVNFTPQEHANNGHFPFESIEEIDASKLEREFPEVLHVKESLIKYVFDPKGMQNGH
ncbi:trifunctional UDP-glucose 4,6-dehydratase/UDP-4-keto-6-deoxy-D-glucose 3,5-epimerase/UDP-4-keto-L-rhamnose-reductase RHM1-like [Senna tora]|uniref:Trifunctional UDP-glucose 4,6-dehydratase/UDP-4-keto-6-deoxy-D-glucose 3,5-epimerase/UDP-4-keto-L-rhamnose-reductase RHM1-like n=1 Tax=Senna tora TaxID=362788 RepID=A0A834WWD2_9FABA|nr:trifunctional UDP-glucose 4,6-dehydratase/UDP-4-keto-6-deoxy-D-glucose 3,5-epimerase/UDP-4-keto-L-rhamnose-reductase RHM1-like [Senna tora]